MDEVVSSLLFEEMQRKYFEMAKDALAIHGRSKEKGKKRDNKSMSKSLGRSKSPNKSKVKCWNCEKTIHLKQRVHKEENKKKVKKHVFDFDSKTYSQDDTYAFFIALGTYELKNVWLIESGTSFHRPLIEDGS